jgi:hypothetical protein
MKTTLKRNASKKMYELCKEELVAACQQSLDCDDYSEKYANFRELLKGRFYSEYEWHIKQVGLKKAAFNWLQGLALPVEYMTFNINELANKRGINGDYYDIDRCYWETLSQVMVDLLNQEKAA